LRELSASDTAVLLGAVPGDAVAVYRQIAPALSTRAREFWNRHDDLLAAGLMGCGLLERYIGEFRDHWFVPLADPIRRLFECPDLDSQREVFLREIYSPTLESAFRAYFGAQMAGRGRDLSQYKYVDQDAGAHLWQGFRHAFTEIPAQGNFYLEWLLTGRFADLSYGPLLLRPAAAARLGGLVDRVTIVCADLSEYLSACAPGTFAAADMSDIFEYLDPRSSDELFIQLARAMQPGGRIAHWNMMVDRRAPATVTRPLSELSAVLHAADRIFFYSDFIVDEVI
jgi:S-adenosylmethionine-diacylglycerol 3-amino-3-carboxypropyl transferase